MSILDQFFVFLIRWDIPIYFICGVALLINIVRFWQSRSKLRRAMFGFERETGQAMRSSALLGLFIFALIAGGVYYVNVSIAPSLPPELLLPATPPPDIFATPLSSPTPQGTAPPGSSRPRVTPNLVATATLPGSSGIDTPVTVPAVTSTRPPAAPPGNEGFIPEGGGCTPAVNIANPRPGTTIFGTVEFQGSATADGFGAYTIEMRGSATGNEWIDILGGRSFIPVSNGILGTVNLATLDNGAYDVRLTVFDANALPLARCTIQLTINNE